MLTSGLGQSLAAFLTKFGFMATNDHFRWLLKV